MSEELPQSLRRVDKIDNETLTQVASSPETNPQNKEVAFKEIGKRLISGDYNSESKEKTDETSLENQEDNYEKEEQFATDNLEDDPFIEKVNHPDRLKTEKEIEKIERKWHDKEEDIERQKERNLKDINRHDRSSQEPDVEPADKIERALDKADFRLRKHFTDYYTEGAIDSLSEGKLEVNPQGFITAGFMNTERPGLDKQIPESQQEQFWTNYKIDVISEKVKDWNQLENIKAAEKIAIETAIERGAFVKQNGIDQPEQVRFALPVLEKGDGPLQNFMHEYDIDLESEENKKRSFEGFVNIIEAIKNHDDAKKDGFKALDWYFDNFDYEDGFNKENGFLDRMLGQSSIADWQWRQTLLDYLQSRKEKFDGIENKSSGQKMDENEAVEPIEPISQEEYTQELADYLDMTMEELDNPEAAANFLLGKILPPEPTIRSERDSSNQAHDKYRYPKSFGQQKKITIFAAWKVLQYSGEDIKAELNRESWADGENYTYLRFGCGFDKDMVERNGGYSDRHQLPSENHVIIESDSPTSATYIWYGQGDTWQDIFIDHYKSYAKQQPGVSSKNHDHSRLAIEHMVEIFNSLGIDLIALSKKIKDKTKNAA
ncbi:hypothetical protein IKE97_00240 [Candidatus Saccharibacteria bacterium]|nr:hypothetical protein [Candidatus Saccharibacteria bacterium]